MEMDFNCMPNDTPYVMATIYGYMCYPNPNDAKKRECFIAQYFIKNYKDLIKEVSIEYALKAINFYDKKLGLKQAHNADIQLHIKEGSLAGAMFLTMLEMQEEGLRPSVNKAKFLTYEIYSKRAISQNGIKIEVTDGEKVGRAWNRYKWVAPMWACNLLIADGVIGIDSVKDDPNLFFGLIDSMIMKSKALNLNFECWEFPIGHEFPKVKINTFGLTPLSKKYLPRYNYKLQY